MIRQTKLLKPISNRSSRALVVFIGALALALSLGCKQRQFGSGIRSGGDFRNKLVEQLSPNDTWESVFKRREAEYIGYLQDPQNAKAVDWFQNKPLGVNGIPLLALRVLIKMYPDIWVDGTVHNKLGLPPWPGDYEGDALSGWGGALKVSGRSPLPYGLVSWPDFTGDQNSIPGSENVFFSCAACHTGRVASEGRMRYYPGGAANQVEAQLYAGLIFQTVARMSNLSKLVEGRISASQVKPNPGELLRFFSEMRAFCGTVSTRNPFKTDLPNGGKEACEQQSRLLLAGASAPGADAQLASQLASESYVDELVGSSGKPTLIEVAQGITSESSNFRKLLKNLIGSGVKTAVMYHKVGRTVSFRDQVAPLELEPSNRELDRVLTSVSEKAPPPLFGPRPGQMDAFGLVQGIVYLNATRPDDLMWKYFPSEQAKKYSGSFVQGYESSAEFQESLKYTQNSDVIKMMRGDPGQFNGKIHDDFAKLASQASALSDIKSLFRTSEEVHANWDGNQGASARVLASGVSSVGDPAKVFTEIHETQNSFINNLPSPPYIFGDAEPEDFYQKALRGQELFNRACAECHHRQNAEVYNVGTDPNRAHVVFSPFMRLALTALTEAACDSGKQREVLREQRGVRRFDQRRTGMDANGGLLPYWCEVDTDGRPFPSYAALNEDRMRFYRAEKAGYKAEALYGLWLDAPYFHNGAVPTLRDLFKPTRRSLEARLKASGVQRTIRDSEVRPDKFLRGNPYYNVTDGGFESKLSASVTRQGTNVVPLKPNVVQADDISHTAVFDSSVRGNSNEGHEFWHDTVRFDPATGQYVGEGEWTSAQIDDVIAYLKTL
jgi:cytochrome c2